MERGVLVERPISPQLIVVGSILRQNPTQLRFTQFFGPEDIAGLSAAFPCGPVTRLNLRVVRFAEIGRCEQSYTDADARSAHTHLPGASKSSAPDSRVPEGPGRTCHWLATVQRCVEPPALGGSTILVASVGGPALVMLRARRHLLEGVGGVVHDNERPRLCLAVGPALAVRGFEDFEVSAGS
jgi:hypothetical protein